MKRFWAIAIILTFATAEIARNQPFNSPQWVVLFREQSGGLLGLLQLPHLDSPRLTGMAIYTDFGILRPSRYEPVGSQHEHNPKVSERTIGDTKVISVEGKLKDSKGEPCGLKYLVAHRVFRDAIELDISLFAERTFKPMNGFLAVVLNFSGANEWFARTQKGWLFAEIHNDGRVFQSTQTPLANNAPTLGIANSKTGWSIVLTLKDFKPKDSIDNVLIHANPQGSGGIFLAWCDGVSTKSMETGEVWQISATLKFLLIDQLISAE